MPSEVDITTLLRRFREGDRDAEQQLVPRVYHELRKLAAAYMRREKPGASLQPTALVHEAYLRMVDYKEVQFKDRHHFFALAAQVMRRILVDRARARKAAKRGGSAGVLSLDEAIQVGTEKEDLLISLDHALDRLTEMNPRMGQIVEMRFFGGMTEEEVAEYLGISARTVKRQWSTARLWLQKELEVTA